MAIDQYAPCLCGSGKKLKWCCFDKLREVSQIYRLIESKHFSHAREALDRELAKHPDHPLFLMLKLEYFAALLEEDHSAAHEEIDVIRSTAARLLTLRPNLRVAHEMLIRTTVSDAAVLNLFLDYWRGGHRRVELSVLLEYFSHFVEEEPFYAWWLSPLMHTLGRVAVNAGPDGRRFFELLYSVGAALPGIASGTPPIPRPRDANGDGETLKEALRQIRNADFREAYTLVHALADRSLHAAYLKAQLDFLLRGRRIPLVELFERLLADGQDEFLLLSMAASLWLLDAFPFDSPDRQALLVETSFAEDFLSFMKEGAYTWDSELVSVFAFEDLESAEAIAPRDVAVLVYKRTQDEPKDAYGAFEFSEGSAWDERIEQWKSKHPDVDLFVRSDPLISGATPLDQTVALAYILAVVLKQSSSPEPLSKYHDKFLRGLAQHIPLGVHPVDKMTFSDLVASDKPSHRTLARAIAFLIERTLVRSSPTTIRRRRTYDVLGVEPFAYPARELLQSGLAWLALADLENSSPREILRLLLMQFEPGADLTCEALQILLSRMEELTEEERAAVVDRFFVEIGEPNATAPLVFERLSEAWNSAIDKGLIPQWATDYARAIGTLARTVLQGDATERSSEAATAFQRVLNFYAGSQLKDFIQALFGSRSVPGAPTQGPWEQVANALNSALRSWLLGLRLVEYVSDRDLGLRTEQSEDEQAEEFDIYINFRELAHWLQRYSRPTVVTPGGPAQRLWTPDQGPTEGIPGASEDRPKGGLWVPGQD